MSDKRKNKKSRLTPLKVVLLILIVLAEVGILGFVLHRHSAEPRQDPIVSAPAVEEQTEPTPQPIDYSTDAAALRISEVMAKNTATLMAEDGSFPDWLEISNSSYNSISLKGWSLSDGKGRWTFPDLSIAPGEYLFLYAGAETGLSTGFSLSEGETLTFSDPNGNTVEEVTLYPVNSNRSLIREGDGTFHEADYTTPGFENSVNGFEKACEDAFSPAGPLVISEICTANTDFNRKIEDEYADWVELRNISSEPVSLSGYFLSDKKDNKLLFSLPEKTLAGGEYILIYCSKDYASVEKESSYILAPFSLGTDADQLWLSDANGNVLDYAALWQLPINGSYGREDGRNGWFYYTVSTPEKANTGGCRRIADTPVASVGSGQYNGVESISVELSVPSGRGKVYYTTGDEVTEDYLTEYTGPITLTSTTILRALTKEDGACPSRIATYSYFINENHSFPIISLVANSFSEFYGFNNSGNKFIECGGSVSLIEDGSEVFYRPCAIRLKGFTAVLDRFKKNYGVYFSDRYGSSDLEGLDLFNTGVTTWSSLLIRAGQDWSYDGSCVRNELMEELCHEMTDRLPVQSNKYCILYIDGKYYGIYSLKQDINRQFIASIKGVSKESVITSNGNPDFDHPIWEVLDFCRKNDMSNPELYAQFCEMFDIENLVDYLVLQSYGGNIDLYNNVKYYMSPEEDGKWRLIFYDQDQTFYRNEGAVNIIFGGYAKPSPFLTDISKSLCKNSEFRDKFLRRYAEALQTTLSDENALRVIDDLCAQLSPEIERDRARIDTTVEQWQEYVDQLKAFFQNGYHTHVIDNLCTCLNLSDAERQMYFE